MPPEKPNKLEIPENWKECRIAGRIDVLNAEWFGLNGCLVTCPPGGPFTIIKDEFRDYGKTIDDGLQTCWDNWAGDIEMVFY